MGEETGLMVAPGGYLRQATTVASTLKEIIIQRDLYVRIQNRNYVLCEAWTLLANMLGVHPVVAWSRPVTDWKGEPGWESRVEVFNASGATIGAGEAMCSRSERTWKDRDDFALRAMSQTRATSRALRNPLGFVVKLAGYEATPAEEMEK